MGDDGKLSGIAQVTQLKDINDAHGRDAGDAFLREASSRLRRCFREGDTVARLGGDEFCAVLPDLGESDACLIAERLRAAIAELGVWHEQVLVHTSASIGVVGCDRVTDETMAGLVHAADAALYRAKRAGEHRRLRAGRLRRRSRSPVWRACEPHDPPLLVNTISY